MSFPPRRNCSTDKKRSVSAQDSHSGFVLVRDGFLYLEGRHRGDARFGGRVLELIDVDLQQPHVRDILGVWVCERSKIVCVLFTCLYLEEEDVFEFVARRELVFNICFRHKLDINYVFELHSYRFESRSDDLARRAPGGAEVDDNLHNRATRHRVSTVVLLTGEDVELVSCFE